MTTAVLLDRAAIEALIPHREPFLLLDRVTALEPGQSCAANYQVPADLDLFRGHFPNFPIFPGVMLVEHVAQTACVLMNAATSSDGRLPVLAKVENCSFNGMVRPGDLLETTVTVERALERFTIFAAKVSVRGRKVAKCSLVVSTTAADALS